MRVTVGVLLLLAACGGEAVRGPSDASSELSSAVDLAHGQDASVDADAGSDASGE